jgi:2-polyprenyl-6-methoxyphenol hydroxylase-like FAD-dependent oxidoreductase
MGSIAASLAAGSSVAPNLLRLTHSDEFVTAELVGADGGRRSVEARYLVGCDGAHSAVRRELGLRFEAGAGRFPQLFMLCDVRVEWVLVCVPLRGDHPGDRRYRIATLAPPRLVEKLGGDVPAGFLGRVTGPAGCWSPGAPPICTRRRAARA